MVNDEKETKRRRRQTATATPSIGNKGDAVTATTTSDRDHHRGRDMAASHAAILPTATTPIAIATADGRKPWRKTKT